MERKRRYHNSVLVWNHWLRDMVGIWQFPEHGQAFGLGRLGMPHPRVTFCRVGDPTETRNATSPGEFGIITFDTVNCLAYWILSRTKASRTKGLA